MTKFTNIDKNNLILSNTSGKGFYFLNLMDQMFQNRIKWIHHKIEPYQTTTKASDRISICVRKPQGIQPCSSLQPRPVTMVCSELSLFFLPPIQIRSWLGNCLICHTYIPRLPFLFPYGHQADSSVSDPLMAFPSNVGYDQCRNKPVGWGCPPQQSALYLRAGRHKIHVQVNDSCE